jgi:hypothetical protein
MALLPARSGEGRTQPSGKFQWTRVSATNWDRLGPGKASYVRSGLGSVSGSGAARRTLPAAISRRATTIARLSEARSGFAPFKSCFALFAASTTSSKRLEISERQSSTVILAMAVMVSRRVELNKRSSDAERKPAGAARFFCAFPRKYHSAS